MHNVTAIKLMVSSRILFIVATEADAGRVYIKKNLLKNIVECKGKTLRWIPFLSRTVGLVFNSKKPPP